MAFSRTSKDLLQHYGKGFTGALLFRSRRRSYRYQAFSVVRAHTPLFPVPSKISWSSSAALLGGPVFIRMLHRFDKSSMRRWKMNNRI